MEKFKHIFNELKGKDELGFYAFNVFEILGDNLASFDNSELIDKVLKSEFISDSFFHFESKVKSPPSVENEEITHGSFLVDKLTSREFKEFNFLSFKEYIETFCQEPDWGVDLPVFRELFDKSLKLVDTYIESDSHFFVLNRDWIENERKIGLDYFSYFLLTIIPNVKKNQIVIISYGGD